MKVAVFGHYDSRGGTTALKLPDNPTKEDVLAAVKRYDREVFGIEEPGDSIETVAYGMPARECDKQVHELLYPNNATPGPEDFMFVADLHGDEFEYWEDLDNGNNAVLIDEGDEPETPGLAEYNEAYKKASDGRVDMSEWFRNNPSPPPLDCDTLIDVTLTKPVQLEFVRLPSGYDEDIKVMEESLRLQRNALNGGWSFSSNWTPEQCAEFDRLAKEEDRLDAERNARIVMCANTLKGNTVKNRRWDDDAYGFVVMP